MAVLSAPSVTWHGSWLTAHLEWGPGQHEDGFGLLPGDEVRSVVGFTSWVKRLSLDKQCTYWWITEGDEVLGGIALRHGSHPLVSRAGHLGYGIRPTARRRGLASWALGRVVEEAHRLGMDEVLAVCEADNTASAKTLERLGGVLEDAPTGSRVLRYRMRTIPTGA
ncbi:GNAT family N-acetyltransferase [Arthrobacter antioxidans]|uniref:GNAT family N-acetyltransferase n=1 Tax=Arthrobacter antioxidans TaxID=2895818 RepID=UPI001FFFAED4|nr:GNAT family N-acetyltransferase [Arthrobacter antioxidans]